MMMKRLVFIGFVIILSFGAIAENPINEKKINEKKTIVKKAVEAVEVVKAVKAVDTETTQSSSWKLTPHLYSRGGITLSENLSKQGAGRNEFNLGSWGNESNTIANPLTEATIEFSKDNIKYVYGIDVDNNMRYYDNSPNPSVDRSDLSERLNYLVFTEDKYTFWAGQRAYRGDGDYLTGSFPLDDHNMLGTGVRLEKIGHLNIEFAYGVKRNEDTHLNTVNILINKLEYPLKNGKIKTNLEFHQVNNKEAEQNESKAFMGGVQWQRWGDKLWGGSLYNIALINYSKGYIYGGGMQSAYNSVDKDKQASKIVVKWEGDFKTKTSALYYTFKYQNHKGATDESWQFVDIYMRQLQSLTTHFSVGIDLAKRVVMDEGESVLGWGDYKDSIKNQGTSRYALMFKYSLKNSPFDGPSLSMFVGHIEKDKAITYYNGESATKSENFIRLNYEISI